MCVCDKLNEAKDRERQRVKDKIQCVHFFSAKSISVNNGGQVKQTE